MQKPRRNFPTGWAASRDSHFSAIWGLCHISVTLSSILCLFGYMQKPSFPRMGNPSSMSRCSYVPAEAQRYCPNAPLGLVPRLRGDDKLGELRPRLRTDAGEYFVHPRILDGKAGPPLHPRQPARDIGVFLRI